MNKKFYNPAIITYEVQDINGKIHELSFSDINMQIMNQLEALAKEAQKNKRLNSEIIMDQLATIFDKPADFFNQFGFKVLKNVLDSFNRDISDPIKGEAHQNN